MTNLHGLNIVGGRTVDGGKRFSATNPSTSAKLSPDFHEATPEQIEQAMTLAEAAFDPYRGLKAAQRAAFLDAIAAEIAASDAAVERANLETGLPLERLRGERGRTVNQLKMFARLIEEGSWVDARIDHADPERKPVPKPDLRRMLIPMGPVIVFAASNFPLAFSVAGGDTASAFAAGCPVVVKTHPAHPGTSEIVASLIVKAAQATNMPAGVFSMLHGRDHEINLTLVRHPLARAVGFTGSLRGGRAIFDAACARPDPIPVYAEMGSINPVFVLPGALEERGAKIAEGLRNSVTMGVGQFCTNPGVVLGLEGPALRQFAQKASSLFEEAAPGTMLYSNLREGYEKGVRKFSEARGVKVLARSKTAADAKQTQVAPTLLTTDAATFLNDPALSEELFGPATLLVSGKQKSELEQIARNLAGHLTATIHGTAQDLMDYRELVTILQRKVGRLIFNGFPTGVEVAHAMHHGGPYPATTDSRTTSVGTAAIERYARPICYQDFPQAALPEELREENPRNIWRIVDGKRVR